MKRKRFKRAKSGVKAGELVDRLPFRRLLGPCGFPPIARWELGRRLQGNYFSDPIYKDIDQKLRQQVEHLKKVYADELQSKIKLVEKEYAHNPEEKEKQIKLLMQKHEERMKNIREEAEMNIFQVAFNMIKNLLSGIWHMFW